MDAMDGMEIDTGLEAQQSGIALGIDVGEVTFFHLFSHTMREDVVVDAVSKE